MTPEAQNRLEDLGYKVNPMAAKKAKSRSTAVRIEHKPSGKWYWMDKKLAWGKVYYSFDGGDSWSATKRGAFERAEKDGGLNEVRQVNSAKKKPSAKQLAARRKFAAAAKARAKAAKKRNGKTIVKAKRVTIVQMPKKANPTRKPRTNFVEGDRVEVVDKDHGWHRSQGWVLGVTKSGDIYVDLKAGRDFIFRASQLKHVEQRKRNITSASDLVHVGEATQARQGGQAGWKLTSKGKFYPGSATPKTIALNKAKTKFLDLKYGDVWAYARKGNPRKKNISQGFYDSNGIFHPIRAASDYDAGTAGETGGKAKRTRSKKRKASAAKASRTARDRAAKRAASKTKQHLASRALSRSYSLPAGSKRKKNIAQGFYDGNGIFHPIRASVDYDGKTAGETGGKPRHTRSKKRAASARKASQTARQKAATAQRKATTTRLATRSLQRSYPLKGKRRNPNDAAKASYESFQGKTSTKSTSLNFPNGTPANVYKLGSLHSITLADGRTIKPAGKAVWLCADTKGKLHLGTTGERLTNAPKGSLGKVKEVEYITSKPHLGDSKPARYFHQLGEETGEKPTLYSDGNGGLVFKGGAYSITSRGIVN